MRSVLTGREKSSVLELRARQMRCAMTPSEQALWAALRGYRLGVYFRCQVVVGSFIVDFLAPTPRVIVEVDGGYHARRRTADARRQRKLERLGYRVVRLEAELVLRDLPAAVAKVRAALGPAP
jgi:very-short-patch-repair endonuclease